jgi:hypothetical protein
MAQKQQGDDEDDRVEPSAEWKAQQLGSIDAAKKAGTLRTYTPRELYAPIGPRDDFDIEPRKKGSYTVPKMCGGGKVIKTWSK